MRRAALISAVLVLATLAACWPIRRAEFLNFDDPSYVTSNPKVLHGLTSAGCLWAFTTIHASNWHPLTWLSHMLDCQVFSQNSGAHHLVNLALHAANVLLLFLLLRRMTGGTWRSGFVAALFALHPLHVESVAWISERKDLLSTCFGLLALWAYVRYAEAQSLKSKVQSPKPAASTSQHATRNTHYASRFTFHASRYYLLSLLFFALGLMSKPMLVTLPCVMLLLDFWPLERLQLKTPDSRLKTWFPLLREKLPFLALSLASCAVTVWAQHQGGALATIEKVPLSCRLANAVSSYIGYLTNAVWPVRLAVFYPFPPNLTLSGQMLGLGFLVAATVLAIALARRAPYLLTGWLWFIGTLVPVIGLVQVGSQAMADRYSYLPLVGVFIAVVWGVTELTSRWRHQRLALGFGGGAVLIACLACTRLQITYWQNSIALFSHAIEMTSNNALAEQNLAYALSLKGNQPEALRHFDAALRISPDYSAALLNRANVLALQGSPDEAIAGYRAAIGSQPDYEKAYFSLANALALQGNLDEAATNYLLALKYWPDYAEAHTKLGNLLLVQGAEVEGIAHLRAAVKIQPDAAEAQCALGRALARRQNFPEALACFRAALKADSDYAPTLNDQAWILATQTDQRIRNLPEALALAQRACQATAFTNSGYLDTLAVARSELGQFDQAMALTEKAAALAAAAGHATLAAQLRSRVAAYRVGRSFTQQAHPLPGEPGQKSITN